MTSHAPIQPIRFQKAMVFIDGTNLFHRLEAVKLSLTSPLPQMVSRFLGGRQVVRIYLYTLHSISSLLKVSTAAFLRTVYELCSGMVFLSRMAISKKKGVDALLVADLVYDAAVKNCDYALV